MNVIVMVLAALLGALGPAPFHSPHNEALELGRVPIEVRTVVFYPPHQDDETLSMGPVIAHYVSLGWNVQVVLVTDGAASSARRKLGLSTKAFVAGRMHEFRAAIARLGVPAGHVHFAGLSDGKVTIKSAGAVIAKYEALFPGAMHIAETTIDKHPDHRNVGIALEASGLRANWVVFRPYWPKTLAEGCRFTHDSKAETARVLSAARSYWRIGYVSVPTFFAALRADPRALICSVPRP